MVTRQRRTVLGASLTLPFLPLLPQSVSAATPVPGTPIFLADTPHIYVVGEDARLHWAGDTRALEDKQVLWNKRETWSYSILARQGKHQKWTVRSEELKDHSYWRTYEGIVRLGDPWLSAGLLKDGAPIYLVKWEHDWEYPKLLHIPSIRDVEVFGITEANYGRMVLDKATWEARYGIPVDTLERDTLPPATWGHWQGRPRGTASRNTHVGSEPDWPSILLILNRSYGGQPDLAFACQRGTDRWAAMLGFPARGRPRIAEEQPTAGNPHITYSMPGVTGQTTPQLWRGGHEWAAGWHPGRIAAFTDIPSRPYAQNLLATLRTGVAKGEYDFTYTWHQNGREWTDTLDLSGFATAIAWLDTERARPAPPAPLRSGNRIICPMAHAPYTRPELLERCRA